MILKKVSALAVLALSSAAHAQSNVTIFGIVDLVAGRFGGPITGVNANDKRLTRLEDGGLSTSRFGFSGSEDLGGGHQAIFEISGFIRADTGAQGRSDAIGPPVNVAADPLFSRNAWVGFNSGSLGRLRLGNMTSLLFINSITSNAFGDSTVFSPLNLITFIGGPLTGGTSWTNTVTYDTPSLAGLVASVSVSASENQNGRNAAGRLNYSAGPIGASFIYQDVKKNPLTFADGTSPNNTKTWQLAGSYDFGIARLFGHVGHIQNDGTETAPLDIGYKLWELSGSIPLGAGKVLLGYASRKTDDAVGPVPATVAGGNKERRIATAGYDHVLSKRTDVYAMLQSDRTVTNSLPAPPHLVSASATNFGVGVRHRF